MAVGFITLDLDTGTTGQNAVSNYLAGSTAAPLLSAVSISDGPGNSSSIDRVTISISGGASGDVLALNTAATTALGTGAAAFANGVLTINLSQGTDAAWVSILQGVTFFTPSNSSLTDRTISFFAQDTNGSTASTTQTDLLHLTGNTAATLGSATVNETETNQASDLSTSGTLSISDPDSGQAVFQAQANATGSYGTFSITAAGAWTYTASSAHNEFAAGTVYHETFNVLSADGTATTVKINITGANDAATLSSATIAKTETDLASDLNASGTLTVSDVDSAQTFVAQINTAGGYGSFSINTAGAWTYTASSAHNEFVAGTVYHESFNVASADGTTTTVKVDITGTNDAATLSSATIAKTETDLASDLNSSGTLTVSDVDSAATFAAQTNTAGSYGSFSINTAGAWTYTASSAHNEFVAGTVYHESFNVASADGTTTTVKVDITGTNDAAVLSSASVNRTETNDAADLAAGGTLTVSDVDSAQSFLAQTNVAGSYGHFSITSAGVWTYTADSAHDEFQGGQTYTDSFTVHSADGTATSVTVNIDGSNDPAVVSSAVATRTETNAAGDLNASGTLSIGDVDSPATFVEQSNVNGHYGAFSINAAGAWSYVADGAHNEFAAGSTHTDSFTVVTADGTTTSVTVNLEGTNDAAILSVSVANLTEANDVADISTSGQLTISDVDSAQTFLAQSNFAGSYGHFSVDANGAWSYAADTAHNEFVAGQTYSDTFSVSSADGTTTSVTINILGTNDAATLSSDTASLTETDTALSTSGQLTISDVDSAQTFVAQSNLAGSYGSFSVDANGAWSYVASSAHDEFVDGQTYSESFDVTSADGTVTTVEVNILGTNDAAQISGDAAGFATETDSVITTSGQLVAHDVDSPETFVAQSNVAGDHGYGAFTIDASGAWTYTTDPSAHDEFVGGQTYSDSITVQTADGTTQTITAVITGTNDAATFGGDTTGAATETNRASDLNVSGQLTIDDVDSAQSFVAQSNVAGQYGSFSIDSDGAWSFHASSAHNEFVPGQVYSETFDVAAADGTMTSVTIDLTGSNDAPVHTGPALRLAHGTEDVSYTVTTADLTDGFSDVDGGTLGVSSLTVSHGVVVDNHDGSFTITPDANFNGAMSLHFDVTDGQGAVVHRNDTLQFDAVNDAPGGAPTASLADGTEDTPYTVSAADLLTGFNDVDGDSLSVSGLSASNGVVVDNNDGTYTVTPSQDFNGPVTLTYDVIDGNGGVTPATQSYTLGAVNDAAQISGDAAGFATETDSVITTSGQLVAHDVDSAETFVAQSNVAGDHGYGAFTIDASGAWTYTTDPSAHDEFVGGQTYSDSITVQTADGTAQTITAVITGTNDAAVLSSDTADLTETDLASDLFASGQLSVSDVDSAAAFVAQTDFQGVYGKFSIDASGAWAYQADSAHDEFITGTVYTDTFHVESADGTTSLVTISITGTNDAALLSSAQLYLTETDSAADISATGSLTVSDVDSPAAFIARDNVAGAYGSFSIDTAGNWTYTASGAHDEFSEGGSSGPVTPFSPVGYQDSFLVQAADGTTTTVTINIAGTNDAAQISGDAAGFATETDSVITTSGQLVAHDVDSPETFVAQSNVAGDHGYGAFTIDASGAWTYTTDPSAHDEFVGGQTYSDSITVQTADGTTQTITAVITGTNDAATLSSDTANLTETDTALSTSGQLTISDVDSAQTFVAQSNLAGSYGSFSVDANGAWSYVASSAHDEFVDGQTYTESFDVTSADGTVTTVKVNILGTNDAAQISGDAAGFATETDSVIITSGQLVAHDVDSPETFVAQSNVAGDHGYGAFTIDASGAWTYTTDPSAHDEFVGGQTYSDSITVQTADGTTQTITAVITGTNDAAQISGDAAGFATETDSVITTSGQLVAHDVDSPETFVAQSNVAGDHGYGAFTIDASGAWTYTTDPSAHDEFVGGQTYSDSITVQTADGTTQTITAVITGTNDAATLSSDTASATETNCTSSEVLRQVGSGFSGELASSGVEI